MIAGIILAAGASSRMGHPKALLDLRGRSFVENLISVLTPVCHPVIVVLGYHADRIRPHIHGAAVVENPEPERGQLSSLQTGLAALPEDAEGFFFIPVDCPAVDAATVAQVAAAAVQRDPGTLFVIPRIGDRRGHPVFADRLIASELLALPPTGQARDVVHAHRAQTQYVEVDDPGIFADIDDPDAYRRLKESLA